MSFTINNINKEAVSFKIASKCAMTEDIYSPRVLQANKLNLNFLHHLRSLEMQKIEDNLKKVFSVANNNGAFSVRIVSSKYDNGLKIISSNNLDLMLEALPTEIILKNTLHYNNKVEYIYEVLFKLTL